MPWVITRLCRDCVDTQCVDVCPVDCIYGYVGDNDPQFPNQLYINPDECINCRMCQSECPWEAPMEDLETPPEFQADIALNARTVERPELFRIPATVTKPRPTFADVQANKLRWGMAE
jgi:ferredoxin